MSIRPIDIEGSLTIERVSDIQELMRSALAHLGAANTIAINLNGVNEFDGAGLQLLLALSQTTEKLGVQIALQHCSEKVTSTLTTYGVASRFLIEEQA